MPSHKKVVITGIAGRVGEVLRKSLDADWELKGLDLASVPDVPILRADINDQDVLISAFQGAYAIIHLAANPRHGSGWDEIIRSNITGTKSVFEAAKKAGVQKIIFASSNQVTGLYENEEPYKSIVNGRYEGLKPGAIPMITHESPIRPSGPYGISKVFGEALGRYYSEVFGMEVLCLRIGTVNEEDRPLKVRHYATLLTHRDLCSLVDACLSTEDIRFAVIYAVSANTWRFWDIDHPKRVLGWVPQDNAECFRA